MRVDRPSPAPDDDTSCNTGTDSALEGEVEQRSEPHGSEPEAPNTIGQTDFEMLFAKHNRILVNFLYKKLGNVQDAHDVAQEAYAKVLGLQNDKVVNHLRTYLFKTASNIAIDRLRQRNRRIRDVDYDQVKAELVSNELQPEQRAFGQEQLKRLKIAIQRLPIRARYAFVQYRVKGLGYDEIAREMGVTESMVRKYVRKALQDCKMFVDDSS